MFLTRHQEIFQLCLWEQKQLFFWRDISKISRCGTDQGKPKHTQVIFVPKADNKHRNVTANKEQQRKVST